MCNKKNSRMSHCMLYYRKDALIFVIEENK